MLKSQVLVGAMFATLLLILGAIYGYVVFSHAKVGDAIGRTLVAQVARQLPPPMTGKPGEPEGRLSIAALGAGSEGACEYFLLQKCVALELYAPSSADHEFTDVLRTLTNVCGKLVPQGDSVSRAAYPLGSYFECDKADRRSVRVQVNVLDARPEPARQVDLPGGGATYTRNVPRVRYQILIREQAGKP